MLPGEWFLVRFGGTRKGTGTFYTKPQLAVPTAHRTLRPLAYDPPKDSEGKPNEDAPSAEWTPKRPEEILALKVCDPASGSGSFLVASLRFLTAALVASLHYHKLLEARGENTVVTLPKGVPGSALSDDPIPCRLDDAEFDAKLTARLKRYVVELCIYGVDIDPLAVELCRLALWIETMVRDLPFSFLDHKIKCGNSLVGCWFDRFRDYPALAFQRKGGDEKHTKGVHFKKDAWTKAITAFRTHLKRPLGKWVAGDRYLYQQVEGKLPEEIHDEALARFEEMHALPIQETQERADYYREQIQGSQALVRLKEAFDTWCALWFWPADELSCAPMPPELGEPTEEARRIVHELAREYRFFHWELEFPDVFAAEGAGFDAVVGNPPWEIQKPNSKEFFSNIDPLYRSYGKQDALDKQEAYFQSSRDIERRWLLYNARFKALSSWNKHVGSPFGGAESGGGKFSFGKASDDAHRLWRHRRQNYKGYTDPKHPFLWQGSADTNTYKMFLEVGHALARTAGHIGLLVPSGVYTDKGSTDLRRLFLTKCRWQWLFGFENREKIFDIDSRFKFCPVIVEKGGTTDAIKTAFMHRDLKDWEEAEKHVIPYRREQLERFSPNLFTLVEIRTRDDERFVSQMYSDGILMGAWVTAELKTDVLTELHKTNDSAYLVKSSDVEKLRRHAPVADFRDPRAQLWLRAEGFFSVWEGKNVHMFDNSWSEPQLVITLDDVEAWFSKRGRRRPELTIEAFARPRFVFREIAAPTNERSCIATWLPPQSITTYTLRALDVRDTCPWWWLAVFNSFVFDLAARLRGNLHLSTCYDLLSLPRVGDKTEILGQIETRVQQLLGPFLGPSLVSSNAWAIDVDWRSILRAEVEAMVAALYDLTVEDVTHVLRYDSSDPVGFWRVDANVAPPNRMPTLALEAFRTLSEQGLDRFSSVFRSRIATHTSPSASIAWQPDIGWQRAWEEALEAHPDARLSSKSYGTVADIELPIAAERGERYGVKCDNGVGNSQRSLFEDLEEG